MGRIEAGGLGSQAPDPIRSPLRSPVPPPETKAALRARMKRELAGRSDADWALTSAAVVEGLRGLPWWPRVRAVMLYAPLRGEPDLTALAPDPAAPARVACVPRIDWATRSMVPAVVGDWAADLVPVRLGLREPRSAAAAFPPADLDVVLVPGLAFDWAGRRLGRGAGFYDRFLAALPRRCLRLGVCSLAQVLTDLPAEPHDEPVDGLLCEAGLVWRRGAHGPRPDSWLGAD